MNRTLTTLFYLFAGVFCIRILLALAGLTEPVNAELDYAPVPAYLLPVALHAVYGLLLFAAVIVTGTACLAAAGRILPVSRDDIAVLGLPAGLLACLALSLLSLSGGTGQVLAAALMFAALAVGRREYAALPSFRLYPAVFVVLLAIAFGAHFAFMWRPATALYDGAIDLGDLTIYMGWYHSLDKSLTPFYNYGAEGEFIFGYFNNLHNIYALALDFLPRFDIYLFTTASLGVFYVLSISWVVRALADYRRRRGYADLSPLHIFTVAVLFVAAARYPSWLFESPPVIFMVPIVMTVMYVVTRAENRPAALALALVYSVVGSAISKVVSVTVLGTYTGLRYLQRVLQHPKTIHLVYLGIAATLGGGYIVYMLVKYGGYYLPEWDFGPESWHQFQRKGWSEFHRVIPMLLKDFGLILILAGLFRLRDYALFAACAIGIGFHFAFPFLFTSPPAVMLVLAAACLIVNDRVPQTASRLILIGATLMLYHHFKHDYGKHFTLPLWIFTLAPAVLIALLSGGRQAADKPAGTVAGRAAMLATAMFTLAISLAAVSTADLRLGKKRHKTVTTELFDIWTRTRELTPPDALIFTDQTGDINDRLTGWNDYSLMAQRQFYLSTWSSSRLRHDVDARRARLANNAAVLSGGISPSELTLSREYTGYYAVVSTDWVAPRAFRPVYRNTDYVIYEIKGPTLVEIEPRPE